MGDNKSAQQPDVNEQIKVRMEKLKNLRTQERIHSR